MLFIFVEHFQNVNYLTVPITVVIICFEGVRPFLQFEMNGYHLSKDKNEIETEKGHFQESYSKLH